MRRWRKSQLVKKALFWPAFAAIGAILLAVGGYRAWNSLYPAHVIHALRKLEGEKEVDGPARGTSECYFYLFAEGIIKKGMHYKEIIKILGEPNEKTVGEDGKIRLCRWLGRDTGGQLQDYTIAFDDDLMATFVPHPRRVVTGANGRTGVELYYNP